MSTATIGVQNAIMVAVALVCTLLMADVLWWTLSTGKSLHGIDYLVLIVTGGYLACCAFARPVARKAGLSLAAVGITLLVLETAMAVMSPASDRPWPWYVWPPNYRCILNPANLRGVSTEGRLSTNSRGIRGPEFSPTDRFRILCVGGSTTECLYLDDEKTWSHLLGEELKASVEHLWVGNVGRSGTVVADHVTLLEKLPEAQMVDTWIVLCGVNDMGQQMRGDYAESVEASFARTFSYRRPGFGGQIVRPLHRNLYIYALLENFRKRAQLAFAGENFVVYQDRKATWIGTEQSQRQAGERIAEMPDLPPLLEEYERQLMRVIELARGRDKVLVLLTQPTLWSEQMDDKAESLTLGGQDAAGRYYANTVRVRTMAAYNQRMIDIARRENVVCVDMASMVPHSMEVFYDDAHFNELGAAMVARHLAAAIKPIIVGWVNDESPPAATR